MLKKVQTRMKPEDRERQLLEVAQRMFVERGYQGTAMEDIAKAAGVTRGVQTVWQQRRHLPGLPEKSTRSAEQLHY